MANPWAVYEYEVDMFRSLLDLCRTGKHASLPHPVQNATVESLLLHTRVLVDILLSRDSAADGIRLTDLLPTFDSSAIAELRAKYGNRNDENSPYRTLNKMLAHATSVRSDAYDYAPIMDRLVPLISLLLEEVQRSRHEGKASATPTGVQGGMLVNLTTSSNRSTVVFLDGGTPPKK